MQSPYLICLAEITFPNKPHEETKRELKDAGWRWSFRRTAYVQVLSPGVEASGQAIIDRDVERTKEKLLSNQLSDPGLPPEEYLG